MRFVYKNPDVIINSVDLSSQIESITIERKVDEVDLTAFGDGGKTYGAGLEDDKCTISFYQDFSAASVDATIAPLFGTTTNIIVKPVTGTTATTNPAFEAQVLVSQWSPIDAKVGEAAKVSVTWPINGVVTEVY